MLKSSKVVKKTAKIVVIVSMLVPAAFAFTKPAKADEQTYLQVPKSYTYYNVQHVKDRLGHGHHYANRLQRTIVYDSRWIMLNNGFYDDNLEDKREININHLSNNDAGELDNYALAVLNSVRSQMRLRQWGTNYAIQRVAWQDARNYERDNKGDDNLDGHDMRAVNDAARVNGIRPHYGWNYYEDYTGFFGFHANGTYMTMAAAKGETYFAMKEFLASMELNYGVSNNQELVPELHDLSIYQEWDHARDLTKRGYYQFGTSYSSRNGKEISFHIYAVGKGDIKNASQYYRDSDN